MKQTKIGIELQFKNKQKLILKPTKIHFVHFNNKRRQIMATQQSQQISMIKFKSTNTSHEIIELEYNEGKTVLDYKEEIAALVDYDVWNVKFVFKGKVLGDKEKVAVLGLKEATVMMVLNKPKQVKEKTSLPSSAQVIPKSNLSTGLGGTSPVGFGNYGLVNHPQYMSAISSAVDPQKMNEMLDDPFYKQMIEQMLEDPQTLKQIMEQNPMTKQLMEQNPMMKMIMNNPAMMKMVFNKQTLKMAQEMQKNGGITPESMQKNPLMNSGLFGNNMMQNMMGGTGANLGQPQQPNSTGNTNMFGGFGGGNPFFPTMGSGFGGFNQQQQQGFNFPANNNPFPMGGGMFGNPFFMQQSMFNNSNSSQQPQTTQQQQNSSPQTSNNLSSLFQNLQNVMEKANQEVKYSSQLKQLSSMGFGNKQKNIKYLKQVDGDIDRVLQKLCLDDDNAGGEEKTMNSN